MSHKTFDFTKQGGMPLNQQRLEYMQESYTEALSAVSALVGDMVIVSGCVVTGNNVTDGWVVVGGELLPFRGGQNLGTFLVRESATNLEFKDGQNKPVQISRFCEFALGTGARNFSELARLDTIKKQLADIATLKADNEKLKNRIITGQVPYNMPPGTTEATAVIDAPEGVNPEDYFGILNIGFVGNVSSSYYTPVGNQIRFYIWRNTDQGGQSGNADFMLIKKEL